MVNAIAPVPSVPAATDVDSTSPLRSVKIDALVVLKIAKHCRESFPNPGTTGQLLGLDVKDVLEVTNCFPFPEAIDGEDGAASSRSKANHMNHMLHCLRDVGVDNNVVGWYQSAYLGTFLNQQLTETQFAYQKQLNDRSIVLIHDICTSSAGNLDLKAYRLTPSFLAAQREGKFTMATMKKNRITHRDILEELPIELQNSHLATALLQELKVIPSADSSLSLSQPAFGSENYSSLDLSVDPYLEKNLDFLLESVDDYNYEQNALQFYARQVGREHVRRKAENANRIANGQAPNNDPITLPNEPNRLESLLISAQIDKYCGQIEEHSGTACSKLYFASGAV
ncbi:Eukaryotic translation initiation factor 3 subunit H [Taphrina deformans PYCC 5710]|uniref:Eukaryotic translation initiation factor 3 subunit H n=1 Tax=Taphrina deformans (strain PYCC 5710 / ATCC 11124 / CBS 356.35 / IMI 108563 / JCM 9778 / NBRC 8474) TaxID=1097556 RepID=R4XGK5_TAPDE|nr:Eukaryotic translation initiation factor 3 subunit H [Taphrina deformans PYCC 5710]|eukprot:CCG82499.1 Eukaryotic translation initiation factor 3 subunit H [Taphrina deformans PYCC 5710]